MSVGLDHPAVAAYLARLDAAVAALPPGRREELITEIRAHLLDSLAAAGRPDDATVLGLLDRLGDPESIVAEALEAPSEAGPAGRQAWPVGGAEFISGPRAESRWGPLEIIAVGGLTIGTFLLPIIGPLIGIICAWFSARWTRGEKAIATVLVFGGAALITLGALALVTVGLPAPTRTERVTVVTATPSPVPLVTTPPGGVP